MQESLAEAFKAAGVEARIALAQTGAEVVALAERAVRSGAEKIVAGGGDGTISSVAAAVIGADKVLGILPFGSLPEPRS